ncbi:MAG: 2-amino-4-hydroxy-6-hydroxymethyldihydropteridine diphosphokinase [Pseudomonadota bacterium]
MLVAFGSNLASASGGPVETVRRAIELLGLYNFEIDAVSALFKTPAVPEGSGPDFVNAAARVRFEGTPYEALAQLRTVENLVGRSRKTRWGPRTLDLDLLAAEDCILPDREVWAHWYGLSPARQRQETPQELILPHPRIQDRAFVLIPLAEVAPNWWHPVLGLTVVQMRDALPADACAAVERIDRNALRD